MGKHRAKIEMTDPPSDGLWDLSTRVRALGEIMRCANGQESEMTDAGWHGLAAILLEIADNLNAVQDAIESERAR